MIREPKEAKAVTEEVIGTREKHGFYDEYELVEDLIRTSDGHYFLRRQFSGYYDEVNVVRSEFINDHAEVEISPAEAERWLERLNAPKAPVSEEDLYPTGVTGMYISYSGNAPVNYDGSWFRSLLEEYGSKAAYIAISVGCSIYNEHGRYWEQMSDVIPQEPVIVRDGMTAEDLYEETVAVLRRYRKNLICKEPTAFTERITVYGDNAELGSVENNELPAIYKEMAENIEDFDVLGW